MGDVVAFVLEQLANETELAEAAGVSRWASGQMKGYEGDVVMDGSFPDVAFLGLMETSVVAESKAPASEQKVQHIATWSTGRVISDLNLKRSMIQQRGAGLCTCADDPAPADGIHRAECAAWIAARYLAVAYHRQPAFEREWAPPEWLAWVDRNSDPFS